MTLLWLIAAILMLGLLVYVWHARVAGARREWLGLRAELWAAWQGCWQGLRLRFFGVKARAVRRRDPAPTEASRTAAPAKSPPGFPPPPQVITRPRGGHDRLG